MVPDLFGIFPIFSGFSRSFSGFSPIFFGDFPLLGLLKQTPTRNIPERVRDTIRTFPERSGNTLGLKTPPVELLSNLQSAHIILSGFHGSVLTIIRPF